MKAACAVVALVGSAAAFAPAAPAVAVRSSAMTMSAAPESRREVLRTAVSAAAAAAVFPQLAFADGAVSESTVQRAKGIYGDKVLNLAGAVKAGNFEAVKAESGAISLLTSGGFARASKADKAAAKAAKDAIFAAVESKDAAKLQSAYADLVKLAKIPASTAGGGDTQGYSSDYDWKARTAKGTIYVR
ncbi:extrinsic protein in photosystem II [Tribonema minus]|uniref:Extrinsic protein in photosystem II n=1 Tax=Tribonema minus TaxID=303371 RepID=A0A836CPF3_9STRA|nr:extrinsic protein in photosystem II [Tribonema minus]